MRQTLWIRGVLSLATIVGALILIAAAIVPAGHILAGAGIALALHTSADTFNWLRNQERWNAE